jgi:hypothetical protein
MLVTDRELVIHTTPAEKSDTGGDWVGLKYGDLWLCNSVSDADWYSDPVAPWACWHCGQAWCCQDGLARIVKTTTQVVWIAPYYSAIPHIPFARLSKAQFLEHVVIISRDKWDEVAESLPKMPPSDSFPTITNHDIINAFLQLRPSCAIENQWDTFIHHLSTNAIASHPFDLPKAVALVSKLLIALEQPAIVQPHGCFRPLPSNPDSYNTLYFHDESYTEFITSMSDSSEQPVLGNALYFSTHDESG